MNTGNAKEVQHEYYFFSSAEIHIFCGWKLTPLQMDAYSKWETIGIMSILYLGMYVLYHWVLQGHEMSDEGAG